MAGEVLEVVSHGKAAPVAAAAARIGHRGVLDVRSVVVEVAVVRAELEVRTTARSRASVRRVGAGGQEHLINGVRVDSHVAEGPDHFSLNVGVAHVGRCGGGIPPELVREVRRLNPGVLRDHLVLAGRAELGEEAHDLAGEPAQRAAAPPGRAPEDRHDLRTLDHGPAVIGQVLSTGAAGLGPTGRLVFRWIQLRVLSVRIVDPLRKSERSDGQNGKDQERSFHDSPFPWTGLVLKPTESRPGRACVPKVFLPRKL